MLSIEHPLVEISREKNVLNLGGMLRFNMMVLGVTTRHFVGHF